MKRFKKAVLRKVILVILFLLILMNIQAQEVKTIDLANPGTLATSLSADEKKHVTSLTITGNMDARDFKTMRDEMPLLAVVNLKEAYIKAYTGSEGTTMNTLFYPENQVPQYAFCEENNPFNENPLTTLILPSTATHIGESAFKDCKQLSSMDIPSGIESIGKSAFSYCLGLVSLNISEGVSHIEESAFYECTSLEAVNIPASMKIIDKSAFTSCANLSSLTIAEGVVILGESAFRYCDKLLTVAIPSSVTTISNSLFYGCKDLTTVIIPSSVTSIESNAFKYCDKLYTLHLPASVSFIGESAFFSSGLISISIPSSVKSIKNDTFGFCDNLNSVELPNGLTSIEYKAFLNCGNLSKLTLPPSLDSIGFGSFENCYSLSALVIPEGVTTIGMSAFGSCSGLTSINIPSSVISMGTDAFAGCTGLTTIKAGFSEPLELTYSDNVFYLVDKSACELQVPYGTKDRYAAAYQWKDFTTITESSAVFALSTNRVSFATAEPSHASVEITSGKAWYAESNQSWLTLNTASGIGNGTLIMAATANPSLASRTALIVVTTEGTISQTITVVQEARELNIQVAPGQLSTLLTEEEKSSVTILILSGSIDARDFRIMRDEMPHLTAVDLSNAKIDAYIGNEGTLLNSTVSYPANEIPQWAFFNRAPWNPKKTLTSFIYPPTTVSIGIEAFSLCSNLTSAILPPSMQSIGERAFEFCSNLRNISIPEGIQYIGKEAFKQCIYLDNVTIPSTLRTIENNSFEYCSRLRTLVISEGIQSIGKNAFIHCAKLGAITIPSSVLTIGDFAFNGCINISTLTLAEGLTSIGRAAFCGCKNIVSLNIPSSVRFLGPLAFDGCSKLTTVSVEHTTPLDLSQSPGVFAGVHISDCRLYVPYETKSLYEQADQWKDFFSIQENSVGFKLSADEVVLIDTTGNKATLTIQGNIQWTASSDQPWITVSPVAGNAVDTIEIVAIANPSATNRTARVIISAGSGDNVIHQTVTVTQKPKTVYEVTPGALSILLTTEEKNSFTKLVLSGTMDARDFRTMRDMMPNLAIIDLRKVKIVAYNGEMGTVYMSTVDYPENEIPTYAFNKSSGGKNTLTSFIYPLSATSIGEYAFSECNGLTSVAIPSTIQTIKSNAFNNCQNLSALSIAEGVKIIGESAFAECNSLSSVTIPSSTESIGSYAFYSNNKLETVNIHSANGAIEPYAFYNCDQLNALTLSQGVTSVGESAFSFCTSLTSVSIPSSVISIGNYAFNKCYNLEKLTISKGVQSIGEYAFYECKTLATVTLPESVLSIKSYAFSECYALKSLSIPHSLTYLGESAFYNCAELTSVVIPSTLDSIGNKTFSYCSKLSTLTIKDGVKYIGREAFKYCTNLPSIVIPSSVLTVGGSAFFHCDKLNSLTLSEGITSIDEGAFNHCGTLTSVKIPSSVVSIGSLAFEACDQLNSISLSEGLESIGNHAFLRTSIDSLIIPSTVKSIGAYAFQISTQLVSLTISEGVKSIGASAFSGCTSLPSLTIPSSVTSIGNMAFAGCTALTSLVAEHEIPLDLSLTPYIFYFIDKSTCILYVPYGSKELYAKADQWKEFIHIKEFGGPVIYPAIVVEKRAPQKEIDLVTAFNDQSANGYMITSNSNPQVVTTTIKGTSLILEFSAENTGATELVVTAFSEGKEIKLILNIEVKIPTAISASEAFKEIIIYPNPTHGEVNIKGLSPKGMKYFVYDTSGRIIYQSLISKEEETFNLAGNPPGVYFLKIENRMNDPYKILLK